MATGGAAGALKRFELDGVRDTGREVGHGSYAVVKELEYHGLKCVGKKIHGILFESATPHEKEDMLERFAGECELLSGLHHPCIVQFLGVWYEQGSRLPVLVMEYLHTTLSACLERYGILPKEISYGILHDVALGLRYLHERSPPIIHRDLSANNVLLTSNMNAKLSDLGVAKILNLTPARMTQMTQTKAPGTPCYMPPEALTAKPKYTSKIDIYSYGVLIIHTLCGRWPFPGNAFRSDPRNPDTMIPTTEVERRAEYLQEIGNDHPLMAVIRLCLSNAPPQRPEAKALLDRVNTILSTLSQPFTNRVEMLQQLQTLTDENQSKQSEIDSKQSEIDTKQSEIDTKHSEIVSLTWRNQTEIEHLTAELERLSVRSFSQQARSQPSLTREPDIQVPPQLLHPQAKLQWKRCADIPVGMESSQAVVMEEKIYIGGTNAGNTENCDQIFQYNLARDKWSRLPPCQVVGFAMAQFAGNLITVGGALFSVTGLLRGVTAGLLKRDLVKGLVTGKVYRFNKQSKKWEEFLKPMPTARTHLSVATTQCAIVASGGGTGSTGFRSGKPVPCVTVEVYSSETSQWHTAADPLPVPCWGMTSVTIADTWYLLGGVGTGGKFLTTVLYAPLTTLIQKATSPPHQLVSQISLWKNLPDTPLVGIAAASLSGNLLAVGGYNDSTPSSSALYTFLPLTNSWARVTTADLPAPRYNCTSVQLPSNQLLVVGGCDDQDELTKTEFLGSITI